MTDETFTETPRRLYRAKVEFLFTLDGTMLLPVPEVKRQVQEQINLAYAKMEREDMRVTLQTDFGVTDLEWSNTP